MNHLDRLLLKAQRKVLREENAKYPHTMTPIASELWPVAVVTLTTAKPLAVWRSCEYLAVLYQEPGKDALRLSVCRAAIGENGRFADGLSWEELQQVKSECGYGAVDAAELYPRDVDVVNVANMRHLWILPQPSPWTWRAEPSSLGSVEAPPQKDAK